MAGAFLQGYRDQAANEQQGALAGMQQMTGVLSLQNHLTQQAQAQQKAEEQRQFRGALSALTPEQLADPKVVVPIAMKYGDPNTMLKELLPKPAEPFTLAEGSVRFGPDGTQIAAGMPKPTVGQSIGSGGLRMPDGSVIPPVGRPMQAPPTRKLMQGETEVQQELQADGSWKEIGKGPRFARQVEGVGSRAGRAAPSGYRFSADGETLEPIPGGPKDSTARPLPTNALKLEQAERDAIGTSASISSDLKAVGSLIDDKKLDLGLIANLVSQGRNLTGQSTEQSRNYNAFKTTLERLRNDSLRLNKGVQTEGDSQRAWNELMGSLNDNAVVKQRLGEIQQINDRAIALRKMNVDLIRSNYGQAPLDMSGYERQPAAIGTTTKPQGSAYQDAEKERRYQEWKRKNGK